MRLFFAKDIPSRFNDHLIAGVMSAWYSYGNRKFLFFPAPPLYTAKQNLHMHSHCAESFYSYISIQFVIISSKQKHRFMNLMLLIPYNNSLCKITTNHFCTGSGRFICCYHCPPVDHHGLLIKM